MTWLLSALLFGIAAVLLYFAGELLVSGLLRLSRFFHVEEFVVAFFIMAFAATVPNFFVGITSALAGIPELSYGDVMGNNMVALTIAVALAILFSPQKALSLENKTIRTTTFLTAIAALLPLTLITDGVLSRTDGIVLILFFFLYIVWLFSRRDRFSKIYEQATVLPDVQGRKSALTAIIKVIIGLLTLAVAAQIIVHAAVLVASSLGISLMLIGVLVIGLGGALPELYFTIVSARKGENSMILGNLMGAVIIPATLVLGVVSFISPIYNENLEFPLIGRVFLAAVALFFLYLSRTKNAISQNEGFFLICMYAAFVLALVFINA